MRGTLFLLSPQSSVLSTLFSELERVEDGVEEFFVAVAEGGFGEVDVDPHVVAGDVGVEVFLVDGLAFEIADEVFDGRRLLVVGGLEVFAADGRLGADAFGGEVAQVSAADAARGGRGDGDGD